MKVNFDKIVQKQIQVVGYMPSFSELYFNPKDKIQNIQQKEILKQQKGRRLSQILQIDYIQLLTINDCLSDIQIDQKQINVYKQMIIQSNLKQEVNLLKGYHDQLQKFFKAGYFKNKDKKLIQDYFYYKKYKRLPQKFIKKKQQKNINKRQKGKKQKQKKKQNKKNKNLTRDIPKKISWKKYVIRVEDQGDCASCYSFSVTSAIEILWNAKKKQKIELSDQEIVDCDFGNDGCNGGSALGVLEYIKTQGLSYRQDYPYQGKQQSCQRQKKSSKFKQQFQYFGIFHKIQLLKALQYGPVVVFHHIDQKFKSYQGGLIDTQECHGKLNHSAVVVGYNLSVKEPYIVLMNNWGDYDWGEKGYYRMKLGDLSDNSDMCNMFGHFSNILIKINQ